MAPAVLQCAKKRPTFLQFYFVGKSASGKTAVWNVCNCVNTSKLGIIVWYAPWRKYVFEVCGPVVLDYGCLREIADFVETATKEHRERKRTLPGEK